MIDLAFVVVLGAWVEGTVEGWEVADSICLWVSGLGLLGAVSYKLKYMTLMSRRSLRRRGFGVAPHVKMCDCPNDTHGPL